MPKILGISAFYHDSAAALVCDGKIVAAAQEERFTRVKHDHSFPKNAVQYCLREAGLETRDLDYVVYYEKPLLKFDRLLETYLAYAPRGLRSFSKALHNWTSQKLFVPREIDQGLGGDYSGHLLFTNHHESHAASAFYPSPFQDAAIVTFDGVGEWSTTTWGVGRGKSLELKQDIRFPHSLGLLYSAFTYYCGFKVNSGEYKLMGLAPYGEPRYKTKILDHVIDVKDDGSFWMDQSYFNYAAGLTMTSDKFHQLFGGPPRKAESAITQKDKDVAASIQAVTEEIMLRIVKHVHKQTEMENLCLAGGVALNCVGNGKILREGPFKEVWVQPAAGDAGAALGAALFAHHQILGNSRVVEIPDRIAGSSLGPSYSSVEIEKFLTSVGAVFQKPLTEDRLCAELAKLVDEGNVVGLFQGRMEFGPRALGSRSIIGDPRNPEMQRKMNLKIKFRESFRPFAPSCIEEKKQDYFELDKQSPYMLFVAPVSKNVRESSSLPAVTHVDFSARVQTVDSKVSPRYYKMLKAFEAKTGCPIFVNTSFNIRGEPIACTPEDAYRCFMFSDIDVLVLEDYILMKQNQPMIAGAEEYKAQFKLD